MFKLRSCVWEITLACCFNCRYCGSRAGKARENELTTEECVNVANQLADIGCRRVSLIGGEVFMRKDWREIVGALTTRGIKVNIITNGFAFSEAYISDLQRLNIESVSVSIDGPKEIHDKYRQEGSFERAVSAIQLLTEGGIHVSVITTLNKENAEHLDELFSELLKTDIFAWQLQACSPMGNAEDFDYRFDFEKVLKFVADKADFKKFRTGVADNIGYHTDYTQNNFSGCGAGITSVGIDSMGNVRGCESMYDDCFIEGNLREKSLKEIWEDENAFAYNRKFEMSRLSGKCAKCDKASRCAAGCRSYNYFVHGKMFESPFCVRKT